MRKTNYNFEREVSAVNMKELFEEIAAEKGEGKTFWAQIRKEYDQIMGRIEGKLY